MASRTKTRTQQAASAYLRRGWCAVPVPLKSKKIKRKGWEQERYEPGDVFRYFQDTNIGIHCGAPSGGLVDVDLDCPEAAALACEYLPPTGRVHGRPSAPRTHWWYQADPIPEGVRRYKGPDRETIVELRSTGGQTIVPPSVHPEGEELVWYQTGDAALVDGRILQQQVERLAAASMLAQHWTEGSRHDLALCVAGVLLRHGWDVHDAWDFIEPIAIVAGDRAQLAEHKRAIFDTAEKLERDDPATGIPTLGEIAGDKFVRSFLRWLGIEERRLRIVVEPGRNTEASSPNGKHAPAAVPAPAEEAVWTMPDGAPQIDPNALPYWLGRVYRHIEPFTVMFPAEWPVMMMLPFWSMLWPNVRIQNLNLGVWTLGIGRQGGGKNLGTDELQHLFDHAAGTDVKLYTAGSPEGLWEALEGDGRRVLAYHDEYAGLLKLFSRDHMSHAREALCSLYDMRGVGYLRSKGKSVQITNPFMAVIATTTASALREHGNVSDLTNGYLSRFMICAPDRYNVSPDFSAAHTVERMQLAREIGLFRNEMAGVTHVQYAESGRVDPPLIDAYRNHLGMDTGEIERLEDSLDDTTIPGGRLLARVKKIAGLLAMAEMQPERSDNGTIVYATDDHIRLAIDLTELGYYYANRVLRWIGASSEVQLSDRVLSILGENEHGLTRRELCRRTKQRAADVQDALRLLREEGRVEVVRDGKTSTRERWFAVKVEAS